MDEKEPGGSLIVGDVDVEIEIEIEREGVKREGKGTCWDFFKLKGNGNEVID